MNIGLIGSGNIGATAARLFAAAGHEVAISNSRGPETLEGLVEEIGPGVRAATVEEAAEFGEVVMEAIPFGRYTSLPAERLAGKVFITASNYYPARDGELDLGGRASSELVAGHLPGARVVKAFNTLFWEVLRDRGDRDAGDDRLVILLAGDDQDAKSQVAGLVEDIGFAPVDQGDLATGGRLQQPGAERYGKPLTLREVRAATTP